MRYRLVSSVPERRETTNGRPQCGIKPISQAKPSGENIRRGIFEEAGDLRGGAIFADPSPLCLERVKFLILRSPVCSFRLDRDR